MTTPIHLDVRGKRVTASSRWEPGINLRFKSLAGGSWSATRKEWSWPLTMSNLRLLRAEFGDALRVSDELNAWARREKRRERHLRSLSRTHDAGLARVPELAPRLAEAMAERTYQRSAARFAATTSAYCLADEPGLGKTATLLAGLMEADLWFGVHLVIAPKSALTSTWVRQIEYWTGAYAMAIPEGAAKRKKALQEFNQSVEHNDNPGPSFLVINPAMLRRKYAHYCKQCDAFEGEYEEPEHFIKGHKTKRAVQREDWPELFSAWTSVTLDEAHMLLASNTPSGVKNNMQLQGLLDLAKLTEHRYALTGTPMRGHEENLWGTMDWLSAGTVGGYWHYIDTYFDVVEGPFGRKVAGVADGMRDELARVVDRWFLRRTRAEVRPDLPMGQRHDVLLEMSPKQRKQYEEFEAWGETDLIEGAVGALGVLSERTRKKQLAYGLWTRSGSGRLAATADSPKLEWILQFLEDRGITGKKTRDWFPEEGGYKYVIGSQSTAVLDAIESELNRRGITTGKITGDVSGRERDRVQAKFQSEDRSLRVVLIQTQTGGVAIELDAWCDEMVIVDETDVADEQVQLEGRINNRSGRVASRSWWYLRMLDTIETEIADRNIEQHVRQHELLDERRGVTKALHKKGNQDEHRDRAADQRRPRRRRVRPADR